MTLAELAKITGIGKSTLGNYEIGATRLSEEKLQILSHSLKTPISDLAPISPGGPQSERKPQSPNMAVRVAPAADRDAQYEAATLKFMDRTQPPGFLESALTAAIAAREWNAAIGILLAIKVRDAPPQSDVRLPQSDVEKGNA